MSFLEVVLEKNGNGYCSVEDDIVFIDWNLRVFIFNGFVVGVSIYGLKEIEVVLWSY